MLRRSLVLAAVALALVTPAAAQTTITFDAQLPNTSLGTQFAGTSGVIFASTAPEVRVMSLGVGHAASGSNAIVGASTPGSSCFGCPIFISFVNPLNTSQLATTTLVRIRGDLWVGSGTATMRAFDVNGNQIGITSFTEPPAGTLQLQNIGAIHRVEITQTAANIAFDDLTFGPLTPATPGSTVPEPSTYALLATGLVALGITARRRPRA